MACLVCERQSHRHACERCTATSRTHLRHVELYLAWLGCSALMAPGRGGQYGRLAPGYGSRSPGRGDDVLVLLDPRSSANALGPDDEDSPGWSALGTLRGMADHVRRYRDEAPLGTAPVQVWRELGYLLGTLEWCAMQPWVPDLLADVRELHGQVRALAGDAPRSLGSCLEVGCDGRVYWAGRPGDPDRARCAECGGTYAGLRLARLAVNESLAG